MNEKNARYERIDFGDLGVILKMKHAPLDRFNV